MRLFVLITDEHEDLRRSVLAVVRALVGDGMGVELASWPPGAGSPAADSARDLFLGLGWLRLDGSAEAQLLAARERWRESERGACLLYRCLRLPERLDEIDGGAFDRLRGVFRRLVGESGAEAGYREFTDPAELRRLLAADLERLAASAPEPPAEEPTTETGLERWLHAGEAYEMAFLSCGTECSPGQVGEAGQAVRSAFRHLVEETAASYGGQVNRWSESGGLVVFWRKRRRDAAVMTALKVLHSLPVFNLDLEQNPTGEPLRVRMAVHDAAVVFRVPASEMAAEGIDRVRRLQEEGAGPGELLVTREVHARLDERLRGRFRSRARFDGAPVLSCRLPSVELAPEEDTLRELSRRFERHVTAALERLADGEEPAASVAPVDEAYGILHRFCSGFGRLESGWSPAFLAELGRTAGQLRAREAELWAQLRPRVEGSGEELAAVARAAARRRAQPVAILSMLQERAAGAEAPEADDEALRERVSDLLRADALEREAVLSDLLLNRRSALVGFLLQGGSDELRPKLVDALWQGVDLITLDEVATPRRARRAGDTGVLDALATAPGADPRFRLARDLLSELSVAELETRCREAGIAPDPEVLQRLWRCLLLGHPHPPTRHTAALALDTESMWEILALPDVPVPSLYALGQRVGHEGEESARKIYFDAIRAPLADAIERMQSREEIDAIAELVLLVIEYPFLVESGYFERFDALLQSFLVRSREAGVRLDYFESIRRILETARKEEKRPGKLPSGVRQLPLTLQRRLAGDPIYLLWFVTHPDPRIAGETIRHIGLRNVARVLRLREISGVVMHAILRRPELFTRSETLLTALAHPKCEKRFAAAQIPGLARTASGRKSVAQLAHNPSANPAIRALARQAAARR